MQNNRVGYVTYSQDGLSRIRDNLTKNRAKQEKKSNNADIL